VTVVAEPKGVPKSEDAQLLFQEAKQRRRQRWMRAGIIAVVIVVMLGVAIGAVSLQGGGSAAKPAVIPVRSQELVIPRSTSAFVRRFVMPRRSRSHQERCPRAVRCPRARLPISFR